MCERDVKKSERAKACAKGAQRMCKINRMCRTVCKKAGQTDGEKAKGRCSARIRMCEEMRDEMYEESATGCTEGCGGGRTKGYTKRMSTSSTGCAKRMCENVERI